MTAKEQAHYIAVCECLKYVHRFGYLRNRDIAELVYAENASRDRQAQRLTRGLVDGGLLTERTVNRISRFALTAKGASFVRDNVGMSAKSGVDLLRTITGHRDAANETAVKAINEGWSVITDHEIQTSLHRDYHGKTPDCLLYKMVCNEISADVTENGISSLGQLEKHYAWIEVENSERGGRDRKTVADWIMKWAFPRRDWYVLPEFLDGYLAEVRFVITSEAAAKTEQRLLNYIEENYQLEIEQDWINEVLPDRVKFINMLI